MSPRFFFVHTEKKMEQFGLGQEAGQDSKAMKYLQACLFK
jgi:hypothetical protein